jgi:hypothetical protein
LQPTSAIATATLPTPEITDAHVLRRSRFIAGSLLRGGAFQRPRARSRSFGAAPEHKSYHVGE